MYNEEDPYAFLGGMPRADDVVLDKMEKGRKVLQIDLAILPINLFEHLTPGIIPYVIVLDEFSEEFPSFCIFVS